MFGCRGLFLIINYHGFLSILSFMSFFFFFFLGAGSGWMKLGGWWGEWDERRRVRREGKDVMKRRKK